MYSLRHLIQMMQYTTFLSEHAMLVFGSVYIVLEAADGRLCLCSSFGQTVYGLMCGARVHGVAWVHGGG